MGDRPEGVTQKVEVEEEEENSNKNAYAQTIKKRDRGNCLLSGGTEMFIFRFVVRAVTIN
jgi:hypothetical protein